jgi:hypothetical protein
MTYVRRSKWAAGMFVHVRCVQLCTGAAPVHCRDRPPRCCIMRSSRQQARQGFPAQECAPNSRRVQRCDLGELCCIGARVCCFGLYVGHV